MKSGSLLIVSICTGALSAFTGLLFEIIGGAIAWTVFRGIQGVLFATVIGGITAFLIRRSTRWPASSRAGAIGAMIASFFAIASMDAYEPGSLEWAIKGGGLGAAIGVTLGAILGPIGLLHLNSRTESKADER